jgi:hypothetical protein
MKTACDHLLVSSVSKCSWKMSSPLHAALPRTVVLDGRHAEFAADGRLVVVPGTEMPAGGLGGGLVCTGARGAGGRGVATAVTGGRGVGAAAPPPLALSSTLGQSIVAVDACWLGNGDTAENCMIIAYKSG